jgi:TonB-dependent SusC/RagA subfamily outer membrane receptor
VLLPSSGSTGEGAKIRIRGSASLSQLNEPIVYIDGIRVNSDGISVFNGQGRPSRLDDIPPESIERIEILKGAAAATLYGTEASNGVIQIFTKRGQAGAPRFTAQADMTAITAPTNRILPIAGFARNADEQARISSRFGTNLALYETFEHPRAELGDQESIQPREDRLTPGSTDVGDVSWNVPTTGLGAASWIPGTPPHSWQAVAVGGTSIGAKGMRVAAEALAMTAVDLLLDPAAIRAAREEFERVRGSDFHYEALLGDRDPPLDYRR